MHYDLGTPTAAEALGYLHIFSRELSTTEMEKRPEWVISLRCGERGQHRSAEITLAVSSGAVSKEVI